MVCHCHVNVILMPHIQLCLNTRAALTIQLTWKQQIKGNQEEERKAAETLQCSVESLDCLCLTVPNVHLLDHHN